jgi:hypothetical protein
VGLNPGVGVPVCVGVPDAVCDADLVGVGVPDAVGDRLAVMLALAVMDAVTLPDADWVAVSLPDGVTDPVTVAVGV